MYPERPKLCVSCESAKEAYYEAGQSRFKRFRQVQDKNFPNKPWSDEDWAYIEGTNVTS
jgi:hypothetical protein